jgi:hypothetical protein
MSADDSEPQASPWPFRVPAPPPGFTAEGLAVTAEVVPERGRWVVYLEITFWDEIKRYRIQSYPSERYANIAADLMRRFADRDLSYPPM